jgi:GR25 family glycosyltransferase involved in LPS biosynthesis
MYKGFYINLDRDAERRDLLEQRLEQEGFAGKYTRFPAVDGKRITYGPDAVPGWAALGCLLSHLSVLKSQLGSDHHLHIIEDDALLHRDLGRAFEAFISHEQEQEWDILMTDIFLPPDVYLFKYLHQAYNESVRTGSLSFHDIGNWEFAGANSYFVNKNSIQKVLQLVEHGFKIEVPYDIRLKNLAKEHMLKVYLCFPFLSTLSESCSDSTIAGSFQHVQPLFEYRRSFYIDADLGRISENLRKQSVPAADLHMEIYLDLIKTLMGPNHAAF